MAREKSDMHNLYFEAGRKCTAGCMTESSVNEVRESCRQEMSQKRECV